MTSTLLLVVGITAAWATTVSLARVHHPSLLGFPVMMTGWLVGEFPRFHLVAQVLAAAVLVAAGALDDTTGVAGLVLVAGSVTGLLVVRRTALGAATTAEPLLEEALGPEYLSRLDPATRAGLRTGPHRGAGRHPFRFDATGIELLADLPYGDHPRRNLLDIRRPTGDVAGAPVIIQIHGGAWISGHKQQQAQPLMHRLAAGGCVVVAINYRLGPKYRFPDPIIDVKRAIAWVRTHIAEYGGDPDTVILTGGSAGGHLASLAALTPNRREWQPGFEDVDTTVQGCVPFYGPTDLTNRDGFRGRTADMRPFLEHMVMPTRRRDDPDLWAAVSPLSHVGPDAPPFFVIQGTHDVLVWREEARRFAEELRAASRAPVVYWEVRGAQHAFDMLHSVRSAAAVDAVERFVGWVAATAHTREEDRT